MILAAAIGGVALLGAGASTTFADPHTSGTPSLSSNTGAPYTLYLDFAGFNYTGTWSSNELTQPGSTPAFNLNSEPNNIGTFSATDVSDIKTAWSRVAQSYSAFNINVTTVDPAVAAGQSATDSARQTYYDNTTNVMHMVIGSQIRTGNTNWYSYAADGVSGLGVISTVGADAGSGGGTDDPPTTSHTNWMFSESVSAPGATTGELLGPGQANYVGAIASHENGHALGLYHQSDYVGSTLVNEYGNGDTKQGAGSYVATLGQSLSSTPGTGPQRTVFRIGSSDNNTTGQENDNAVVLANPGLTLASDGIGHSLLTATPLALTGTTANAVLDKGIIVPASSTAPLAAGVASYSQDYFSFVSNGVTPISLTAIDSTEFLTPGTADGVGSLESILSILTSTGSVFGTATEAVDTLSETYTGLLPAGTYFADVASIGGHAEDDSGNPTYNPSEYYTEGAFFLTGSGFGAAVPEPTSLTLLAVIGVGLLGRRRRASI